jgi:hypothetical protein
VVAPGDIISYIEMCQEEGASLQRGMNFRLRGDVSMILMSLRRGAPYADRVEEDGRVLIYEGHDVFRTKQSQNPKKFDQLLFLPSGKPTQNGMFFDAAARTKRGETPPQIVRVYEKMRDGVWVFAGYFELLDAWQERSGKREVIKFKLGLKQDVTRSDSAEDKELVHNRMIPTAIKLEVWKRDAGKCTMCGSRDNLHFDHIIPYSQGGSSLVAENIQLLCARHNLGKRDKII